MDLHATPEVCGAKDRALLVKNYRLLRAACQYAGTGRITGKREVIQLDLPLIET